MTLYTTSSLGGYGEMLLIGNLILLVGLSIARELTRGQGNTTGWLWVCLGFLIGLGLWVFGLTLVYSLPVLAFLLWAIWKNASFHTMRAGLKIFALPVCLLTLGFTVGALPWGIYAAANGFGALLAELTGSAIAGVENTSFLNQVVQHTFNFVLFGGTVIAGLRPPWGVEWLAQPLLPVALAFWLRCNSLHHSAVVQVCQSSIACRTCQVASGRDEFPKDICQGTIHFKPECDPRQ